MARVFFLPATDLIVRISALDHLRLVTILAPLLGE
jgi:hypothetical protein